MFLFSVENEDKTVILTQKRTVEKISPKRRSLTYPKHKVKNAQHKLETLHSAVKPHFVKVLFETLNKIKIKY